MFPAPDPMKIALTIKNHDKEPMLIMEFDKYSELREYFRTRYKRWMKGRPYSVTRVHEDELPSMRAACVGMEAVIETGYRVLDKGERIEKGDEWWSSTAGKWMTTHCEGQLPIASTTYRRRWAGDGYRLLEAGETLKGGDEFLHNGLWLPTSFVGGVMPGHHDKDGKPYMYRRREPAKPEPPEGYYIMSPLEIVNRQDIYWANDKWNPSRLEGMPVGRSVGMYARPLKPLKLISTAGES